MTQQKTVSSPQAGLWALLPFYKSLIDQTLLDVANQPVAVPFLPVKRRIPNEECQMVQDLRALSEAV